MASRAFNQSQPTSTPWSAAPTVMTAAAGSAERLRQERLKVLVLVDHRRLRLLRRAPHPSGWSERAPRARREPRRALAQGCGGLAPVPAEAASLAARPRAAPPLARPSSWCLGCSRPVRSARTAPSARGGAARGRQRQGSERHAWERT
jgi:hypothetical protein